jgi:hypothetical protein
MLMAECPQSNYEFQRKQILFTIQELHFLSETFHLAKKMGEELGGSKIL